MCFVELRDPVVEWIEAVEACVALFGMGNFGARAVQGWIDSQRGR